MNLLRKLFDHEYKEMKKFTALADKVMALDEEYSKLTDTELQNKTEEFRNRLRDGETLDDILVEAFATAREAAFRVLGEKHFYVQILGGLAIHYGNIAEMNTLVSFSREGHIHHQFLTETLVESRIDVQYVLSLHGRHISRQFSGSGIFLPAVILCHIEIDSVVYAPAVLCIVFLRHKCLPSCDVLIVVCSKYIASVRIVQSLNDRGLV